MAEEFAPLEEEIRRRIARAGSMTVAEYMALCLTHPQHGYYVSGDPIGAAGDFTTAPEISQMFGEIIGLWAASVWRMMGSPKTVRLVELGPGRGTMMADALRAAHVLPGFLDAVVLHLIEISPVLEAAQRAALDHTGLPMLWHRALADVPAGPVILLANEYVDALPVHQAVRLADGWHERVVTIDARGDVMFGLARAPIAHFDGFVPRHLRDARAGDIFEWRRDRDAFDIARRVVHEGGAALVIDYGHVQSALGDTLQAVGRHAFADPLRTPGRVDLTAHVDFQAFAQAADGMGARVHGPRPQGEFLKRLGILHRADALRRSATAAQAHDVDIALARLVDPGEGGMGRLFQAIAVADPALGALPGFD